MPWVNIYIVKGHTPEKKRILHEKMARSIYETLEIPPEWVKINIQEMQDEDHSIGGIQINHLPGK
jgi:4-oxalocrotonate tautomerase family enzyme